MLSLFVALACVSAPSELPSAADPWLAEVQARVAASNRAFSASAMGLVSETAAGTLSLTVESGGVELIGEDGSAPWGVRLVTKRVGRVNEPAEPLPTRAATLGRCTPGDTPGIDGACIARAELRSPGVVEFLRARDGSYERGFELDEPAGTGDELFIDIAVEGASVVADARNARFVLPDGRKVRYDGLYVTDAGGVELASHFEPLGDGLRIVVNVANARFPITVDPTLAPA